jgi:hypothetical protein
MDSSKMLDHPDKPGDDWVPRMSPFPEFQSEPQIIRHVESPTGRRSAPSPFFHFRAFRVFRSFLPEESTCFLGTPSPNMPDKYDAFGLKTLLVSHKRLLQIRKYLL